MRRALATAKIERIIKTIETIADPPLHIKEIYVFGSYAAGSPNPRDIDLILVHEQADPDAVVLALSGYDTWPEQKMNRLLKSNNAEKIDIIYATSLDEARKNYKAGEPVILVWSRKERNWEDKIKAIQVRENIGSAPRQHFTLDLGQCQMSLGKMELVQKALSGGGLSLAKVRVESIPLMTSPLEEKEIRFLIRNERLRNLFRIAMSYVHTKGSGPMLHPYRPRVRSQDDAIVVDCGKPQVHQALSTLLYHSNTQEWCGLPFPREGRPHELWVLTRGPDFRGFAERYGPFP